MQISVSNNIQQVVARMDAYRRDVVEKAIPLALNRTGEMAVTYGARAIKDAGSPEKIGEIKSAIRLERATSRKMIATIYVARKPIPLIKFGTARQTKSGVVVKLKGRQRVIKGAFLATMPNGHKGIFKHADNAKHITKMKAGKRVSTALPIKELYGPSVGGTYANDKVQAAMRKFIDERFELRLVHEIKRLSR